MISVVFSSSSIRPCLPLLSLLALPLAAHAQYPSQPVSTVVKLNAFQPLVRSYQLEVEKLWRAHPRNSFSVVPQLYRGRVTELSSRNDIRLNERVNGYGLELQYRHYFAPSDDGALTGFYAGAGPHFQRLKLAFEADGWQQVQAKDGLSYYQYGPLQYTETIRRHGAAVVAGYQGPLDLGPIFMDFYVGLGLRGTTFRSALPESRYRTSMLDYAHQGFYIPAGFKLGVAF